MMERLKTWLVDFHLDVITPWLVRDMDSPMSARRPDSDDSDQDTVDDDQPR